jgi:hypothetical protein
VAANLAQVLIELEKYPEAEAAAIESDRGIAPDLGARVLPQLLQSICFSRLAQPESAARLLESARSRASVDRVALHAINVARAEAELAVAIRDWEAAWAAFRLAADRAAACGLRPDHARLLKDWAVAHLRRGGPEDLDTARRMLGEARAEFEAMGSAGYVRRIEARLAELVRPPG